MPRVVSTTRVLVMSDIHVPHQDETALRVVEDFKKDFKPHITLFLGDIIDAYSVSTFVKDVAIHDQLDEFEICNELLDRFQPTVYFDGNHEERFRRPSIPQEYRRLLDPRKWLKLHKRGIKWIPYSTNPKDIYRLGSLSFLHGFYTGSTAARRMAQAFGCCVFGHTHAAGEVPLPNVRDVVAFNTGCLCDLYPGYMATRPNGLQWCHAFGYGYIYRSGNFTFDVPRIIGDIVHINGKEYKI